jgi:hypothetical protein
MARGLADLAALANQISPEGYVHGDKRTAVDSGIYGFIANVYFYDIDTPLKKFVVSNDGLVRHCRSMVDSEILSSDNDAIAGGAPTIH